MRGEDARADGLFSYLDLEARVPADHSLRAIRVLVDEALAALSADFARLYSKTGRPSIAPEKLLRALLLQAFYTIRSERQLMEQLDYNLLFRWFVGLSMDAPVWEAAQAHQGRVRLDQDHRRPGQDPASRARPGGLDVHAHRRRLQPGPAAQTARRGADMMPHSRATHPKTRHERAANFDPRRP